MALLLASTGIVAASIISAEAAAERRRRRQREWQQALVVDPGLRAELAMMRQVHAPAWLLLVHVEGAQLAQKLASKDLRVCVKLGEPGRSLRQSGERVRSEAGGEVFFGSTFAFPFNPLSTAPVVRIRLERVRLIDQTVAKEEFWLPFGGGTMQQAAERGAIEQDVLLFDRKRDFLGSLRVICQLQAISAAELSALGLLGDVDVAPFGFYGQLHGYGPSAAAPPPLPSPPALASGSPVLPGNVVVGRPIRPGEEPPATQGVVLGSTVAVTGTGAPEGGKVV